MNSTNLGQLLDSQAANNPSKILFRFNGVSTPVGEVAKRAARTAALLKALGVNYGSRVAVMLPNGIEFPITWFALAKLGAVIVPLNPGYGAHDLGYVIDDADVRHVVTDSAGVVALREKLADAVDSLCNIVWTDVATPGVAAINDVTLAAATPLVEAAQQVGRDSLLNLQYTSGTTGFPKGCMLTHGYWLELADRASALVESRGSDVAYTCQPFYYMDPQWMTVLCLAQAIPLVIAPRFSASTFWRTICDEGVTLFYCIGTMPIILFKQPENADTERGHRLRAVYCSGIYPDLHAQFEARWGVPWREVFGMTETGVDIAMRLSDTSSVGSGSVGRPIAGKLARIVDSEDQDVAEGQPGELVMRGSPMMLGYWKKQSETEQAMRNGWLHTGDIAVRATDGSIRLVGRMKDMIRRAGENIAASEVEAVLCGHPEVLQAAVMPASDPTLGEEVWAFILPKAPPDDVSSWLIELNTFVQSRLARFKVPRYWTLVDHFPMTPSERVAKHRLKEAPYDVLFRHDVASVTRSQTQ